MAELLGCGLVRAALGMQGMTEPELKALMEQCTEAVTAAADATEAEAQERPVVMATASPRRASIGAHVGGQCEERPVCGHGGG